MRQIRVESRNHVQPPSRPAPRHTQTQARRCPRHPGVHMVLAGSNPAWHTIRYLCPMCHAAGRPPVEVATGVINAYWPDRNYGFIDNGGPRIFFHLSEWLGRVAPAPGMQVTCQVEQNDKGLIGRQVRQG